MSGKIKSLTGEWERYNFGHGADYWILERRCPPYIGFVGYGEQEGEYSWLIRIIRVDDSGKQEVETIKPDRTYSSCSNAKRAVTLKMYRLAEQDRQQQLFDIW